MDKQDEILATLRRIESLLMLIANRTGDGSQYIVSLPDCNTEPYLPGAPSGSHGTQFGPR